MSHQPESPTTEKNIAARLIALAAQEGHDGEDWDLVQAAGLLIRRLQDQQLKDLQSIEELLQLVKFFVGIAERGYGRPIRDDEKVGLFVLSYVKELERLRDIHAFAEPKFPDTLVDNMHDEEVLRYIDYLTPSQLRTAAKRIAERAEELKEELADLQEELDDSSCDDCAGLEEENSGLEETIQKLEALLEKHGIDPELIHEE